jgi:hypothetical protein
MVLRVEFDQFAPSVKRVLGASQAFVASHGSGSLASAADPKTGAIVLSEVSLPVEDATRTLAEEGLEVSMGSWSPSGAGLDAALGSAYVAAVAYSSDEPKPGLWMDAYSERPTLAEVLRTMYDEFRSNGEVPENTSLEEFIRLANPNVVILSPEEIGAFALR